MCIRDRDVAEGEELVLHGRFVTHPSFGEQFRVEAYEVSLPETVTAIRRYLASGVLPYIGKALAGRIVDLFGEDTLEVIASQPMSLTAVKGISEEDVYKRQVVYYFYSLFQGGVKLPTGGTARDRFPCGRR